MENKEVKKEPRQYTQAEQYVANSADRMFDQLNSMIRATCDTMLDLWDINKAIVDDIKLQSPMSRLIEMFEWYLKDWRKKHAGYLANNHLKLSKDDKNELKEMDKKRPADIEPAKQVKQLILG